MPKAGFRAKITTLNKTTAMSLGVNELKPKTYFLYEGEPCVVLETHHLKMQQRRPVVQTRFRNLKNGKLLERNFAQSDVFEEADVEKAKVKYLYNHRGQYWFCYENDPSKRFELSEDALGGTTKFLKPNTVLEALMFEGETLSVELPIKMTFEVTEAPPSIKGNTAQGGLKSVTIETGASINVPLFINTGDMISVNTETGEYYERLEKGK